MNQNEFIIEANSREEEAGKRLTKHTFRFKERIYTNKERYFIVIRLEPKNEFQEPLLRQQINIDIAFADEFDF